ncbi:MAG: site-2 protease family protein [Clostridiales bacterium]|nr:site-2 protease family protein [Clostridiales bacterium]
MYILLAIIAFGILIAVHELGHFVAAKAFDVKVVEFSIGMGPRLFKRQKGETLYSLRALPLGGSCVMEGEDEEVDDPRSFTAQKPWKRFIILFAGSFMNFVLGAVVVFFLVLQLKGFVGTTITDLSDDFPSFGDGRLEVGDTIVAINGERLYYSEDFSTFMSLYGSGPVDITVVRNGEKITFKNAPLYRRPFVENGQTVMRYGITFNLIEPTFAAKVRFAGYQTMNFVRLIRISLGQLISGQAGIRDLSGPVGIVSVVNEMGQSTEMTVREKLLNIAYFFSFIAVNLAVFNLLPIPALDGGRILSMFLILIAERISRKKVSPKYEGYFHAAGFILLMGLALFVLINDVLKIVGNG